MIKPSLFPTRVSRSTLISSALTILAQQRRVSKIVLREPDVAVDPKQRAADGPRIGNDRFADLAELRPSVGDEVEERLFDLLLEPRFVLREPCSIVVRFELGQEIEQAPVEVTHLAAPSVHCEVLQDAMRSRQPPLAGRGLLDRVP